MENDLYGLDSEAAAAPGSLAAVPAQYMSYEAVEDDRVQMAFGSDPIFPGASSAVSDAASMAAAEVHRRGGGGGGGFADEVSGGVREKIASHPLYPKLLEAYIDGRKVEFFFYFPGKYADLRSDGSASGDSKRAGRNPARKRSAEQ
ncbi:hypothetical protein TIFTF001_015112 [Ficus carica]|uniref:KNOX1 domain-containing protein n=1 Tax=Ficus carica TaxID=3494 RepID=A0AA88D7L0_FICCA|nr:hypothetical protein TIFTF001_015112 [Ficus carica]